MKYLLFLFILNTGFQVSAQDSTEVYTYNSTLQVGEGFDFGKGAIKFKGVLSDSRCPREVTCIWAGEAKILVEFYQGGNIISEKIVTVGAANTPVDFSVEGILYNIDRLVLEPYPSVKRKGEVPEYNLHVSIKKNKPDPEKE